MSLSQSWSMTVLVDAGHGGTDHGAVRHDIREADIALKISKMIRSISKKKSFWTPRCLIETQRLNHSTETSSESSEEIQSRSYRIHPFKRFGKPVSSWFLRSIFKNQLQPSVENFGPGK